MWLSNNKHSDLYCLSLRTLSMLWAPSVVEDVLRSRSMLCVVKSSAFAMVYDVSSEQFTRILISARTSPSLEPTCLLLWQVNKGMVDVPPNAGDTKPWADASSCASCLSYPHGQAACASAPPFKTLPGEGHHQQQWLFSNSMLSDTRNSRHCWAQQWPQLWWIREFYCWVSGIIISPEDIFRKAFP